ncbi:MAG: hypothetical protein ABSB32_05995 [Thermodesulfobacteriota bacterium]
MTKERSSIQSKVKSLVAGECPNYQTMGPFGANHYCFVREKSTRGVCVFFSDLEAPRCRYFEESILPLDKDLRGVFSGELLNQEIREGQKRMIRKKCERPGCPETFFAKSNAQRFCPRCQKAVWNEKTRIRMANHRKKPNGVSLVTI